MSTKMLKPIIPATSSSASARAILAAAAASASTWSGYSSSRKTASSTASSISSHDAGAQMMEKPKRKRQRLDHLTQEEKIMRRKLKNRMAAQSARDRKKVKMQDLEGEIGRIQEENEALIKRNAYLEKRLKMVELENETLRKRLASGGADSSVASSTSMEENLLRLMNGMPNTDCDIDIKDEDQWSDAEDDIVFDDVNMMADSYSCSNSYDGNQSDVSDDSGLMMNFSAASFGSASASPLSSGVSSSGSSPASATTSPLRRLADESIESAEGSGLEGAPTSGGRGRRGGRAAGTKRPRGGAGGKSSQQQPGVVVPVATGFEMAAPVSGALNGDHLNFVVPGGVVPGPVAVAVLPAVIGGAPTEPQDQFNYEQVIANQQAEVEAADLGSSDILSEALDELLGSFAESYDGGFQQQQQSSGSGIEANQSQAISGLAAIDGIERAETVEQLFASIDQCASMELTACGSNARGVPTSAVPSATSTATGTRRSVSPTTNDHDYIRSSSRNRTAATKDANNNCLDLLDSIYGSSSAQKLHCLPLSPLSSHSSDFGYESASSPSSDHSTSPNKKNPNSQPFSLETSPLGAVDLADEDEYLMASLGMMQPSSLDPELIDDNMLELFPELF